MKSNNPVFNDKTLNKVLTSDLATTGVMTIEGAINKTGILFLLLVASSAVGWSYANSPMGSMLALGGFAVGLVSCLLITFKPTRAATWAPVYAVAEGLIIGSITSWYEMSHPGIAFNAMALTVGCLGLMLFLYRTHLIVATARIRGMIVGATLAIGITYLLDMVMMMFGHPIAMIHEGGTYGIIFSVVVVAVAALNLILDFAMIEESAKRQAPKYMEWYAGFALMVTIVWLYLEILRLLSKVNSRR